MINILKRFKKKKMDFYQMTKGFCVLPGGADINPEIYGSKQHPKTHWSEHLRANDEKHIAMYKAAIKKGIPIFAICRGHQLVGALNGLKLIQHTNHMYGHQVLVKNLENNAFDSSVLTNSCHHQMVWTNNELIGPNWEVLGFTSKISTVFHGEEDNEYAHCIVEPEIMIYPEIRCITTQFHPEWMHHGKDWTPCLDYLQLLIEKYI